MVPTDLIVSRPRPVPLLRLWSLVVAYVAVVYFLWTPFDVPVRALGATGSTAAVGIAGLVLGIFLPFVILARPVGLDGRRIWVLSAWLVFAVLTSTVLHGGILGPREYTGNFLFRTLLVLASLAVGHRLACMGLITPRTAALVGTCIVLSVGFMMGLALLQGTAADQYRTQGLRPIGTPSGSAVQSYLLAYAAPLLFFMRAALPRTSLFLLSVGAVLLTYRRGPFAAVVVPLLLLPFVDRRASSGRRWYLDVLVFVAAAAAVGLVFDFEAVFVRWVALFQGKAWALSERDVLYPLLVSQIFPMDWESILGHGIGATVVFAGEWLGRDIFAHNDWLELAVSVGLLGVVPFFLLHVALLRGLLKGLQTNRYVGVVGVALYGQFFLSNWTEGVLYAAQHGALLMFFLGACLGWSRRRRVVG